MANPWFARNVWGHNSVDRWSAPGRHCWLTPPPRINCWSLICPRSTLLIVDLPWVNTVDWPPQDQQCWSLIHPGSDTVDRWSAPPTDFNFVIFNILIRFSFGVREPSVRGIIKIFNIGWQFLASGLSYMKSGGFHVKPYKFKCLQQKLFSLMNAGWGLWPRISWNPGS